MRSTRQGPLIGTIRIDAFAVLSADLRADHRCDSSQLWHYHCMINDRTQGCRVFDRGNSLSAGCDRGEVRARCFRPGATAAEADVSLWRSHTAEFPRTQIGRGCCDRECDAVAVTKSFLRTAHPARQLQLLAAAVQQRAVQQLVAWPALYVRTIVLQHSGSNALHWLRPAANGVRRDGTAR